MSCNCSESNSDIMINQLDLDGLSNMRALAAEGIAEGMTTQRLWLIGAQPSIATGTADGKKGCVTVPYLGIPVKLCWDIKEFDPIPPTVSVKVRITISVRDVEYFSAIIVFKCDDVANPSTCSVSIEGDHALVAALRPSCNWGCLGRCAPGCIGCGTNYWCWAGCAASCVLRCCRL